MFYPYGSRINYWDNYDLPPSAVFFEMILTPSRFTLPGARPDLLRPASRPHHPGHGRLHQLLYSNAAAYRYSTAGYHIAPAFQPHGVGDCYGCSCPSQGTGNMFACEVNYQGFASGPGPFDVFRVRF